MLNFGHIERTFWTVFIILPIFTGLLAYDWLPNEAFNEKRHELLSSHEVCRRGGADVAEICRLGSKLCAVAIASTRSSTSAANASGPDHHAGPCVPRGQPSCRRSPARTPGGGQSRA